MSFILKIYHNFESYQTMLITLGFYFLYHKLQLCFVCHTPHLHVVKDFFQILKFQKKIEFLNF